MAATLDAITACNVRLRVDNDGGVLDDISGHANLFGLTLEHQAGEFKTFYDPVAEDWFRCTQCGRRGTGAIRVIYDKKENTGRGLLENWWFAGGQRTIAVDVPHEAGGVSYWFEAVIIEEPIELDPASADAIMLEFSYQVCGKVHREDVIS